MTVGRVKIVWMSEATLPGVLALERESGLSPWGLEDYRRELNDPSAILLALITADEAGDQAGPLVGLLAGRVVAGEFQLENLALAPEARRQGFGSKLLMAGLQAAAERGANGAVLEVRSANTAALALYHRFRFTAVGRRRAYYQAPSDDALIMVCEGEDWRATLVRGPRA